MRSAKTALKLSPVAWLNITTAVIDSGDSKTKHVLDRAKRGKGFVKVELTNEEQAEIAKLLDGAYKDKREEATDYLHAKRELCGLKK